MNGNKNNTGNTNKTGNTNEIGNVTGNTNEIGNVTGNTKKTKKKQKKNTGDLTGHVLKSCIQFM